MNNSPAFKRELYKLALMHACPKCEAKQGKRCGWWQEPPDNRGYPQIRRWHTTATLLHGERATLGYRGAVTL